jgi:hypothetical protein
MAAGIMAAGLPLLTESASAQTASGWYLIMPNRCNIANFWDGTAYRSRIQVFTSSYANTIITFNEAITGGIVKVCYDGAPFYAWWNGQSWDGQSYYVTPGLQ